MEKRWVIRADEDDHWFVIPANKQEQWSNAVLRMEKGLPPPKWAHPINGPQWVVEFSSPTIRGEPVQ